MVPREYFCYGFKATCRYAHSNTAYNDKLQNSPLPRFLIVVAHPFTISIEPYPKEKEKHTTPAKPHC